MCKKIVNKDIIELNSLHIFLIFAFIIVGFVLKYLKDILSKLIVLPSM